MTIKKKTISQTQVLIPLIKYFIRDNLKLKNCVIDNVCWIVHRQHEFIPYLMKFEQNPYYSFSEKETVEIGNLILTSKELWPLMLLLSIIERINQGTDISVLENAFGSLLQALHQKELMFLWTIPSIINVFMFHVVDSQGNELAGYGIKKGPGMKNVMDAIRDWMILHPHGTTEECVEDVINKYK